MLHCSKIPWARLASALGLTHHRQVLPRAPFLAMSESETANQQLHRAVAAAGDLAYEWDIASDQINWFGKPSGLFGPTTTQVIGTIDGYLLAIHPEDREHRRGA